ncbi:hypothetical protein ACH79_10165 [Bradyrhizobium sp. CCBAU 051011]|uniref:hypothetical protein n=1 Tax=Bradyrhizobium sp. CCBAU 051011 TaxID=858422 RepID=UPI0013744FF3|nr:hypothetical protein [Bradyrhizobium sp. CCBAU 051011]QHO72947.1 hypothetical protein ACH79_10165 [Bradyrhizobium sp. CCBAU 051011]
MPLPTAAKEGVGIVRVPSWQAEADLAAGHLVRLRLRTRSGPLHLMFQPSRRGFSEGPRLRRPTSLSDGAASMRSGFRRGRQ